jgi:hypothetical protein
MPRHVRKSIVLLLFVIAILSFGWTGFDYAKSGEVLRTLDLEGERGATSAFELDPSFSPLRLLLDVDYTIQLETGDVTAFEYEFNLLGPGGQNVLTVNGRQLDKSEDATPTYETKSYAEVLKTFAVAEAGMYVLDWRLSEIAANISRKSIVLRQNVRPLQVSYLIVGGACFALGILILVSGRRRRT